MEKEIKIYTVIPYFSNSVDVFINDVKSFLSFEEAKKYGDKLGNHYDITESELQLEQKL